MIQARHEEHSMHGEEKGDRGACKEPGVTSAVAGANCMQSQLPACHAAAYHRARLRRSPCVHSTRIGVVGGRQRRQELVGDVLQQLGKLAAVGEVHAIAGHLRREMR